MSDHQDSKLHQGWRALVLLTLIGIAGLLVLSKKLIRPPEDIVRTSPPASRTASSFITRFENGHEDEEWYISDFEMVDHFMQVGWSVDHVGFSDGGMTLKISDRPSEHNPYSAAEYQRRGLYGHGRYEVVMRAAKGSGIVSAFFTHTGDYFGDPHDEIDIEFLGKDTTRIHLNYFNNGKFTKPVILDLPYDAAEEFHLYAFEWTAETIRWFIDNELVREVSPPSTPRPPTTSSRIIMDIWSGSPAQYDWHGKPEIGSGTVAVYKCVSFRPHGSDADMCSTSPS